VSKVTVKGKETKLTPVQVARHKRRKKVFDIEPAERISLTIVDGLTAKEKKELEPIYYGKQTRYPKVRNVVSTGCPNVDLAIARDIHGNWGLPCGRFVYLVGKEKSGKTSLYCSAIRWLQENGGAAYLLEGEHTFDAKLAAKMGIDTERLVFSQPNTLDEVAQKIISAVEAIGETGNPDNVPIMIVVDSISSFPTAEEVKADFSKPHMGGHARIMSKLDRKISGSLSKLNILLLLIFQQRAKIGVMFGDNTAMIGGDAIKYHCSVGLKMGRISYLKKGDVKIGIRSRITAVHNKCRNPWGSGEIDIYYGKGIDTDMAMFDALKNKGIITRTGSYYKWGNTKFKLAEFSGLLDSSYDDAMKAVYGK
jgi:recombination protein RecA